MSARIRAPRRHGAALARTVAEEIAKTVRRALAEQKTAAIALAGGSTPAECYRLLAVYYLEWGRVLATVTDERLVPPSHPRSNEKMIRETLLREDGLAARARFQSLSLDFAPPALDLALLGMGEDLHIASLFSSADLQITSGIARTVSPDGEARLSLPLPALTSARRVLLMFAGDGKYRACRNAPPDSPAGKLLSANPEIFCD